MRKMSAIRKISEHRWDAGVKSAFPRCVRIVIAKHSPERLLERELPIEAPVPAYCLAGRGIGVTPTCSSAV